MVSELKELLVADNMVEAEIIKSKLASFDIPCLLRYETSGRLFGITMDGLSKVKIMVPEQLFDEALEILAEKKT